MIIICMFVLSATIVHALNPNLNEHWTKFKDNHNKNYENPEEEQQRRDNFEKHLESVMQHNAKYDMGLESYQKSVDHQHADMTYDELQKTILGLMPPSFVNGSNEVDFSKMPSVRAASVDWRTSGRVTAVKDQGKCGSCWAFAAVGALEGYFAKCGKEAQQLSEQYLMDCSVVMGNFACNGGHLDRGLDFISLIGGLPRASDYPYQGKVGFCPIFENKEKLMPTGLKNVVTPKRDEEAVANALVSMGPLAVPIHVDKDFMLYKTGIFVSKECTKWSAPNHGVVIVGMGTDPVTNMDYWLIKNSWGAKWGDGGFIKMKRNSDNMCGVASNAMYPTPLCK